MNEWTVSDDDDDDDDDNDDDKAVTVVLGLPRTTQAAWPKQLSRSVRV